MVKSPSSTLANSSGYSDAGGGGSSSSDGSNATASSGIRPLKVKRTRKSVPRDSPMQRSSIYRGVTRHRWTGRFEAHLWDKNSWNESQNKKGRQVYLGAYNDEEAAAHAYDLAALKYWGQDTILNFPLSTYEQEVMEMEGQSREEYIGSLRRKSSGFSRGVSKYRGVARHHHNGRWEARIGRVLGNKYLYLGTYATQEEAAVAYDMAAIEYRGLNAVTNFDLSRYIKWIRPSHPSSCHATATATTSGPALPVAAGGDQGNLGFPHHPDVDVPILAVDHNNGMGVELVLDHNANMGIDLHTQLQGMGAGGRGGGVVGESTTPTATEAAVPVHTDSADYYAVLHPQRDRTTATPSSALGMLLQSSMFQEMMLQETTPAAAAAATSDDSTASTHLESLSPPSSSDACVDAAATATNLCSFPEDIQTYFDAYHGDQAISYTYMEGANHDDIIFGDLVDFTSTIFDC